MANFVELATPNGPVFVNLDRVSHLEQIKGRIHVHFAANHKIELDLTAAKPILDAIGRRDDSFPAERTSWTDEQIRAAAEAFQHLRQQS